MHDLHYYTVAHRAIHASIAAYSEGQFPVTDLFPATDIPKVNFYTKYNLVRETQFITCEYSNYKIIAFRGTTWDNTSDARHNLNLSLLDIPKGKVHRGFFDELMNAWMLIKLIIRSSNKPVCFTGHSKGGALAQIATKFLFEQFPPEMVAPLTTFGSPRAGDSKFAKLIDKNVTHLRFVNANDIVTKLPLIRMGYRHSGITQYITTDGDIITPKWGQIFLDRWQHFRNGIFSWATDQIKDHTNTERYRDAIHRKWLEIKS